MRAREVEQARNEVAATAGSLNLRAKTSATALSRTVDARNKHAAHSMEPRSCVCDIRRLPTTVHDLEVMVLGC